jgi:hypothetical protein
MLRHLPCTDSLQGVVVSHFNTLGIVVVILLTNASFQAQAAEDNDQYDPRCRPNTVQSLDQDIETLGQAKTVASGTILAGTLTLASHIFAERSEWLLSSHQRSMSEAQRLYIRAYYPLNMDILRGAEEVAKELGLEAQFAALLKEEIPKGMSFHDFLIAQIQKFRETNIDYAFRAPYNSGRPATSLYSSQVTSRLSQARSRLNMLTNEKQYLEKLFDKASLGSNRKELKAAFIDIESTSLKSWPGEFVTPSKAAMAAVENTEVRIASGPEARQTEARLARNLRFAKVRTGSLVVAGVVGSGLVMNYWIDESRRERSCPPGSSIPRASISTSSEPDTEDSASADPLE